MAEHIWSVLCNKISVDRVTNILSIFDVREGASFKIIKPEEGKQVVIPINLTLVSMWIRSDLNKPESIKFKPVVLSPDGKKMDDLGVELVADLVNNHKHRTNIQFMDFPISQSGFYRFQLEVKEVKNKKIKWNKVCDIPFEVNIQVDDSEVTNNSIKKKTSKKKTSKKKTSKKKTRNR
jgi:hypothetical protein